MKFTSELNCNPDTRMMIPVASQNLVHFSFYKTSNGATQLFTQFWKCFHLKTWTTNLEVSV